MKGWLGALLLLSMLLGGCLVHDERAEELPEIVIGSDSYPPFYYLDEKGEAAGIDADIAREAFRRMGLRPKFSVIDWKSRHEYLACGHYDCIWGCPAADARDGRIWIGPYMKSVLAVAVAADSDIESLGDLENRTLAVEAAKGPERILLAHKDSRIPRVRKIIATDSGDVFFSLLSSGRVDAIAAHREALLQYNKDYGENFRILGESLAEMHLGVAFRQEDSEAAKRLGIVLKEMQQEGMIEEIAAKYLSDAESYMEGNDHQLGGHHMEEDIDGR